MKSPKLKIPKSAKKTHNTLAKTPLNPEKT
jgi:hypothetical protein